eukprot:TRINITY_DN8828_c0_g1_i1.p1 TRINITY_DN8828_c0_g1~~TRINITY_DN8828_c0_g1_i1.p1  ORF type:complete len:200 (+),score=17.34 TRINITY_DN8828_c0_g1_i1:574-1173(+)
MVDMSEESTLTALKQISLADQLHSNKFDPILKNSLKKYSIHADYDKNTRTLQSKEQLGTQPQVVTLARKIFRDKIRKYSIAAKGRYAVLRKDYSKKLIRSESVLCRPTVLSGCTKWEEKPLCSYSHLSIARKKGIQLRAKVSMRMQVLKAIDSFGDSVLSLCLNKLRQLGLDERLIREFMTEVNATRVRWTGNARRNCT